MPPFRLTAGALRLAVICTSQFLLVMDFAIVNVALPQIRDALGFSEAGLAWVTSGYALTFGGFLLLAGRVADFTGRRRSFLAGISLFTIASAVCGLAPDPATLVAGRLAQGAGAALTAASALALIATSFAPGPERTRALAAWGAVGGLGAATGVVLGGALAGLAGWESIFLLNLPVGVVLLLVGHAVLPATAARAGRVAVLPAFSITAALGALMFAFASGEAGWRSPSVALPLAAAAVLLAVFVVAERRTSDRMLPKGVLVAGHSAAANVVAFALGTTTAAYFFLSPYLQEGLGYSPLVAGLAYLIVPIGMMAGSTAAGRLAGHLPPWAAIACGAGLMAAGLLHLSAVPVSGEYLTDVLPGLALLGFGRGLSAPPNVAVALDGVDPRQAGAASGLLNTSLQLGAALAVAVLANLASDAADATEAARSALLPVALAAGAAGVLAATALRTGMRGPRPRVVRPAWPALGARYAPGLR